MGMARIAVIWAVWALGLVAASPAASSASFAVDTPALDASPNTQAGAVTNVRASFSPGQSGGNAATAKTAVLGLPGGFSVNPTAVPRCGGADFASFQCPASSQVGLITVRAEHEGDSSHLLGTAPVYALVPGGDEPARLGFVLPTVEITVEIPVTLRTDADYGPDLELQGLPQATPVTGISLTLWGSPADLSHDSQRFPAGSSGEPAGCPGVEGTGCLSGPTASGIAEVPMLRNPTDCSGPLQSRLELITHQSSVETATAGMPGRTGCGKLGFSPLFLADVPHHVPNAMK